MLKKKSYITVTDQFCGAGGSSQGATNAIFKKYGTSGGEVKLALNHWDLAIETHNTNFPDTDHVCTDIQACDPAWYPPTDILITSPECTNHSLAKGTKRKHQGQLDLFKKGKLDASAERSRATMWDVPRFAERHGYNIIIVENVVDARRWRLWDAWLLAMHSLGYRHKCCFINSMHCHPTPQSRDRMYIVFWKKGNPAPDLEFRPLAYCVHCNADLEAYQSWKSTSKKWGKFGQQYVYRCSQCTTTVQPYFHAAFNAIDWTHPIQRIGDRSKPLAKATEERIRRGLDKFGGHFFTVTTGYSSGVDTRLRSLYENVLPTQPSDARHGVALPFFIKGEHSKAGILLKNGTEPLHTQTTRQSMSFVVPFIIGNYTPGWQRDTSQPLGTVTCKDHHGVVVQQPLIIEGFNNSTAKSISDRLGCITTKDKYGLLSSSAWNSFITSYYGNGDNVAHTSTSALPTVTTIDRSSLVQLGQTPQYEDCYYRMLKPNEVQKAMAFDDDYIVVGNSRDQVKQLGNAVTPPAMEWLVDRCIETLN
jgi:DNA (cytosine-5)-methyltransferase 1